MAFACCVAGAILWKRVNVLPCRFLVAGTALSADAFYHFVQAQHFVTWRSGCFDESQCQGPVNMKQSRNSWPGQNFVSCLQSGGSVAKILLLELCVGKCSREVLQKSVVEKCWRKVL